DAVPTETSSAATGPAATSPTATSIVRRRRVRRRRPGWGSADVLRTAALVMAMYLVGRLVWFANPLFLTAFLGILFGLAVSSGVDLLTRWRLPRGLSAALIVICFFGALFGFGAWMAPTLHSQGIELRRRLPDATDRVVAGRSRYRFAHHHLLVDLHRGRSGDVPSRNHALVPARSAGTYRRSAVGDRGGVAQVARHAADRDGHARHRDDGAFARARCESGVRARAAVGTVRVHPDARADHQLPSRDRDGLPRLAREGAVGRDRLHRRTLS